MNQKPEKTNRLGCLLQLFIAALIITAIAIPLLFAFFGVEAFKTGRLTDLERPERFDPIKHLPVTTKMAGPGARYAQLVAEGVRSDGTVDLTASWGPTVLFQYVGKSAASDLPLGAPGSGDSIRLITVRADRPGWNVVGRHGSETYYDWSRGLKVLSEIDMPAGVMSASEPPACSLKTLWDHAIARGVPADAVAQITHSKGTYSFSIKNAGHSLRFGADCAPLP